jgi:hypothetical protein
MLWDCKVTPAYCVCQVGNTIGCILSNDGLGAGVGGAFSTEAVVSGQWPVVSKTAWGARPGKIARSAGAVEADGGRSPVISCQWPVVSKIARGAGVATADCG